MSFFKKYAEEKKDVETNGKERKSMEEIFAELIDSQPEVGAINRHDFEFLLKDIRETIDIYSEEGDSPHILYTSFSLDATLRSINTSGYVNDYEWFDFEPTEVSILFSRGRREMDIEGKALGGGQQCLKYGLSFQICLEETFFDRCLNLVSAFDWSKERRANIEIENITKKSQTGNDPYRFVIKYVRISTS